jgi:hypothetical protein
MSENRSQIEAMLFKPVPGGFIHRAPNPWIFGRADHYIVTEAQKADILDVIVARRPFLQVAVITVAMLLWGAGLGTLFWLSSGHEDPTGTDLAIMILLTLGALFVALHLAIRRKAHRLQPILAGAPRTSERITPAELRKSIVKSVPLKAAVWIGVLWTFGGVCQIFALVIRNARHPLFGDAQSFLSLFLVVLSGLLAARYFNMAIGRARRSQIAA